MGSRAWLNRVNLRLAEALSAILLSYPFGGQSPHLSSRLSLHHADFPFVRGKSTNVPIVSTPRGSWFQQSVMSPDCSNPPARGLKVGWSVRTRRWFALENRVCCLGRKSVMSPLTDYAWCYQFQSDRWFMQTEGVISQGLITFHPVRVVCATTP